jgi:hypothetical protein
LQAIKLTGGKMVMKLFYSVKVCLVALVLILATTSSSFAYIDGDIDHDGVVRMDDALLVMRYFMGTQACGENIFINANISCSDLSYQCGAVRDLNNLVCLINYSFQILARAQGLT